MSARRVDPDYDRVAATGLGLLLAIILIASLPLLAALLVDLPEWLNQLGSNAAPGPRF